LQLLVQVLRPFRDRSFNRALRTLKTTYDVFCADFETRFPSLQFKHRAMSQLNPIRRGRMNHKSRKTARFRELAVRDARQGAFPGFEGENGAKIRKQEFLTAFNLEFYPHSISLKQRTNWFVLK
tara:strand:- start:7177 stop:7548 length:372 start_codon:yes stop_codon:yes gene_type:complete